MTRKQDKQAQTPICFTYGCDKPATCLGDYEGEGAETYSCDDCCGHGCEDGHCELLVEVKP